MIKKHWKMIALLLLLAIAYERGMSQVRTDQAELFTKLQELELEKRIAMQEQEELQLQVASQNDPEWIKLTLMKRLGLVPEGQTKIYVHP